jgi:hypothetical protein
MKEGLEVSCHGGLVICSFGERREGSERDARGRETIIDRNRF